MHRLTITALAIGCGVILVVFPLAASKGKLHAPGYIGIALLAFLSSFIFGIASGNHVFAGSLVGVVLSLLCFWSAAAGVGSILAVFFCRDQVEV